MAAPSEGGQPVADVVQSECALLATLLDGHRRPQVYRHHTFYRHCRHAMVLAKKCFSGKHTKRSRPLSRSRLSALTALQRCLVRAAEDCTAELAARRIDTAALSLACLGVISRLGCCVGRSVVSGSGTTAAAQLWPAAFVAHVAAAAQPQPAKAAVDRASASVPKESYGGVVNALVRRNAARRRK